MDKKRELTESTFRGADLKLFVRDVRDKMARKRPITVRSWSTIKDIKDIIQRTIHVPASSQRLYFGPLMTSGFELPNHRTLHDAGIYKSGETILLDIAGSLESALMSPYSSKNDTKNDVTISSSVVDFAPRIMKQIVLQSRRALALGLKPELVLDGSGGTYFLHDARKTKIAVFKPADEEPYAENNPRGYLPQVGANMYLREGVVPGEACIREVAAFMLDHKGFSDVPMTTLVEARHPAFNTNGARLKVSEGGASIGAHSISNSSMSTPSSSKKVGSVQEFVRSECTMDDISPSKISVDEVHKIAVLDIRLMNADRNAANLLCRRRSDNSFQLVPIDHGFCLRSVADVSWMDWCWLDWPQMKQPVSEKTKEYILNLDIAQDARVLNERLNIGREALDYFCASSSILKAGIKAGLTLYDIAVMCCRNDNLGEVPSKLEALFSMAADLAESAIENGRWHHSAASRALAEQLTPNAGSLLLSTPSSRIKKCVSDVNINLSSVEVTSVEVTLKDPLPEMVQSSASDSSSDATDEIDQEEREEWAANLIADVSLEQSFTLLRTKTGRSLSIETEGSDDSSTPQGFWCTNPNDFENPRNDDDSWGSWESLEEHDAVTDYRNMSFSAGVHERRESYNPFDHHAESSFAIPNIEEQGNKPLTKSRSPTKVKFEENTHEPPETDARFKHSNSDVGESVTFMQWSDAKAGIKRSQSYSGLSTVSQKITFDEDVAPSCRREQEEQHREYFLSFVDLVIVRETTALANLAKQAA